jgi:drug/metabolite transporter (DMT)-like permease
VVAAVPLWVVLLRTLTGDRPAGATLFGVLVGFAGIAVLLTPGGGSTHVVGIVTVLFASLSWSIGSFASPRLPLPADPFVTTVYEMLCGGALMLVVALLRGEPGSWQAGDVTPKAIAAFAYLVVAGSIMAFTAYVWLLRSAPLSLVATYAYVNPTVAVVLGATILGEHVGWPVILGGVLVIASVALVVSVESRRPTPAKVPPVDGGEQGIGAPDAALEPTS